MEPFGEVRDDLRMARMLNFYYDSKRGKRGERRSDAQFVMYDDISERANDAASPAALARALGNR